MRAFLTERPAIALKPFSNPLLLPLIRPQLDAGFGRYPGGLQLLHRCSKTCACRWCTASR